MQDAPGPAPTASIGFCTPCYNRLWQLKQTLGPNLEQLGNAGTMSLVDYGSTDGMAEWVWSNFRPEIGTRLHFFEVTNKVLWNVSKAKNLAHRISPATYLFNLDADNFIDAADIELVSQAASRGAVCSQFSGDWTDGTYGRIGAPRDSFMRIGGYDEGLLPMGA